MAGQALEAVHIRVDAGVEELVARNRHGEIRVKNQLVEHGEVAVHTELEVLGLVAEHAGARGFGTRAGNGGAADLVGSRVLHELPALIVLGAAGVGQEVAHAFAGIHGGTAAEGEHGTGEFSSKPGLHVLRICVHAVGGGLICRVHVNDDVAGLDRQASGQIVMFKEVIKEPDSGGAFLSAGGENIPELIDGTTANHHITNVFGIAIHIFCSFLDPAKGRSQFSGAMTAGYF